MNRRGFISMLMVASPLIVVPHRKFFLPAQPSLIELMKRALASMPTWPQHEIYMNHSIVELLMEKNEVLRNLVWVDEIGDMHKLGTQIYTTHRAGIQIKRPHV